MRVARLEAGFRTHRELAKAMSTSRPAISRAESPNQAVPSETLLIAWARACRIPVEEFTEIVRRAKSGTPEWFGPFLSAEQVATRLRFWEPIVVPGICQTEPYMRCLVKSESVIGQRLERQKQVLGRAQVTVVVDHRVLSVGVGSPVVMSEQCGHLVRLVESDMITLHVVPAGADIWLGGALAIASHKNLVTVNMATMTREIVSTEAGMVEEAQAAFDSVLGASLATLPSLEFVRTQEEIWKTRV
jgi:transcriptional regulator with XRE-family HTH domain